MNKFTVTEKGYSIEEVNKFVDDVIAQTESILEKMKRMHHENDLLRHEVDRFKRTENDLKNALFRAEQSSSNIKKEAYEEKNAIIEDARKNASRIVNDALLRAEKIEIQSDTLERNMRLFKKKLKLVVEQQLSVIDEIEDIDLK